MERGRNYLPPFVPRFTKCWLLCFLTFISIQNPRSLLPYVFFYDWPSRVVNWFLERKEIVQHFFHKDINRVFSMLIYDCRYENVYGLSARSALITVSVIINDLFLLLTNESINNKYPMMDWYLGVMCLSVGSVSSRVLFFIWSNSWFLWMWTSKWWKLWRWYLCKTDWLWTYSSIGWIVALFCKCK